MGKFFTLSLILLSITGCGTSPSNNSPINNIQNDISEFFPKVKNTYDMHYTIFKDKGTCKNPAICAMQFPIGYSKDDGSLKITKVIDNKVQASFKIKNGDINKVYQINESENLFWKKISETMINFHLEGRKIPNKNIIWSISGSDEIVKIRAYLKGDSNYYEEYKIREIKAKIDGVEDEAIFQVSKEFGIISFEFKESYITGKQLDYTNTIIGKFVNDKTPHDHPIYPG